MFTTRKPPTLISSLVQGKLLILMSRGFYFPLHSSFGSGLYNTTGLRKQAIREAALGGVWGGVGGSDVLCVVACACASMCRALWHVFAISNLSAALAPTSEAA